MAMKQEQVKTEEPLHKLWDFLNFTLDAERLKSFNVCFGIASAFFHIYFLVVYQQSFEESFQKRMMLLIPFIFIYPTHGSILIRLMNYYSVLHDVKNTTLRELLDKEEFVFGTNKPMADKIERNCYFICAWIAVITSMSYLSFHPVFGNDNLPSKFAESFNGIAFHLLIFVIMILMAYCQVFPIYFALYVENITLIHHLRLKEYIVRNLFDKYDSFNIINSKHEQELIYENLKKCTQFHRLLIEILEKTSAPEKIQLIVLYPIGLLTFVSGMFYIFEDLNPADNFRVVLVLVAVISIFTGLCTISQQVYDTYEELHQLFCNSNWIYWNTRNRKYLLILLPNTARKVEISLAGLVVRNHELILNAAKLCYTLLTVSMNLRK